MDHADTNTRTVESELLSRVREDDWNREHLLRSVTADLDTPGVIVELGLERLLARGEVYQYDGEVKRA